MCPILKFVAFLTFANFVFADSVQVNLTFKGGVIRPVRAVPQEFLSIALDASAVHYSMSKIDWRKMTLLSQALAPGYLRIGGTVADHMHFVDNSKAPSEKLNPLSASEFYMTSKQWDQLNAYAQSSNLSIIFDMNAFFRNETTGAWDWHENSEALLNYSQAYGYALHFELGNEPDHYSSVNMTISPKQLAEDYGILKNVTSYFQNYYNSLILGPAIGADTPAGRDFLKGFLENGADQHLDALTLHYYYFNGKTANLSQFLDPKIFDSLANQIKMWKKLKDAYALKKPNLPMWLGETSTAYNSGAPGMSDSFVAGFLWLDKLGLCALQGIDMVIRQTIYGGSYSLLDEQTDPRPDYWLSLLYKRLVGPHVLEVDVTVSATEAKPYIRFYGHCKNNQVTLFGLNLLNSTVHLDLHGVNSKREQFTQYLLTAKDGNLTAKTVLLNGNPVEFNGSILPTLEGIPVNSTVSLPPYSMVFFTVTVSDLECI